MTLKSFALLAIANEIRGLLQVSAHGGAMMNAAMTGDLRSLVLEILPITITGAAIWLALRIARRMSNV